MVARWSAWIAIVAALLFFANEHKYHPRRFFQETIITTITVFIAWSVSVILKFFIDAPRPFVTDGMENIFLVHSNTSFPSGHATIFFALATAIFLYSKKVGYLFFIFAILISLSRIIAHIHYPLDIFAGTVIGILVGYFVHKYIRRFVKFHFPQKSL